MADGGVDKVGEEKSVAKDSLGAEDHELHEPTGLSHFEKGQQVHAFVVGVFEEGFDPGSWVSSRPLAASTGLDLPAIVPLHPSQAAQMSKHPPHHARDPGNGFEEDESDQPFAFTHDVWFVGVVAVAGEQIGPPS